MFDRILVLLSLMAAVGACGKGEPAATDGDLAAATDGSLATDPGDAPSPPPNPPRLALVVAIDDYAVGQTYAPRGADEWWDLKGSINDSRLVVELLQQRFGFKREEILVLRNEQATHAEILRSFDRWLIQQAGPDTQVLMWYSGHGSRAPDLSKVTGEEADGKDSTLVPWDARGARGDAPDLSDDELYSLLRSLAQRTPWITMVFDCCHAGGITRGPNARRGRWLPELENGITPEMLRNLWPAHIPFLDDDQRLLYPPLPVVTISACGAEDQAEEYTPIQVEDRATTFGAMTWFMAEALSDAGPQVTWAELIEETALRVSSRFEQQVQATGPIDRQVLGGGYGPPLPGFRAVLLQDELSLSAGGVHGLAPGQQLELFDLTRAAVGSAEVMAEGFGPYEARARLLDGQPAAKEIPLRAVPTAGGHSTDVLTLTVEQSPAGQAIEAALRSMQPNGIRFGSDATVADLVFLPGPNAAWHLIEASSGKTLWREADQPPAAARERAIILMQYLGWEVRYRRMLDLTDGFGGIPLKVSVNAASADRIAAYRRNRPAEEHRAAPFHATTPPRALDRPGRTRDMVEFQITLDESFPYPAHITMICASEDRSVHAAWPVDVNSRENILQPGQTLTRPIEVYFNDSLDPAHPIRDRWIVIATVTHADFSAFRGAVPQFVGVQTDAKRSSTQALPEVLRGALELRRTRGSGPLDRNDWTFGIASLDLMLEVDPN